ncbi:hypothetical protein TWF281_007238 [Arthrobotrys megalospora]
MQKLFHIWLLLMTLTPAVRPGVVDNPPLPSDQNEEPMVPDPPMSDDSSTRVEGLKRMVQLFTAMGGTPPPVEATEGADSGSQNLQKHAVEPSFFYSPKGLYVQCLPPRFIYDLKPWESPDFPEIQLEDWVNWDEKAETRDAALFMIRRRQEVCRACDCDEQGKVIPAGPGCSCMADLIQPVATDLSTTVQEYQNALDSIPLSIRLRNRDYRWRWGGRGLGFTEEAMTLGDNYILPGSEGAPFYPERPRPERPPGTPPGDPDFEMQPFEEQPFSVGARRARPFGEGDWPWGPFYNTFPGTRRRFRAPKDMWGYQYKRDLHTAGSKDISPVTPKADEQNSEQSPSR